MNIDKFQRDHARINDSVTKLRELVRSGIPANAAAICTVLLDMNTVIKLHLAAEDRFLYPALSGSSEPNAAATARQFQDEMGGIAKVYGEFAGKWLSPDKIRNGAEAFRAEANAVFKALNERIQREERALYPLALKV
jgi:hypothetical protein